MFNRFSVEMSSSKISILLNGCGLQNYKKTAYETQKNENYFKNVISYIKKYDKHIL